MVVPMTLEEGEKVATPVVAKKGEKLVVPMDPKEGEGKLDLGGFHDSLLLNPMKMVVELKHFSSCDGYLVYHHSNKSGWN